MRQMIILLVTAILCAASANAQVSATFDADIDGWRISGDDNWYQWAATGGNPGGYLDIATRYGSIHDYAVAPVGFLGDWSAMTASDTLSYDIMRESVGDLVLGPYIFRIAGPGGAAHALDPATLVRPLNVWTTYAVSLDPSDWTIESGNWEDILENVTSLRLDAQWLYGAEAVRIDNIHLTSTPVPVFTGCRQDDFNAPGLADWSFSGITTATNSGSGGNGLGFVQIGDYGDVNGYGFAPGRYLGDWRPLEGTGHITIDIRVVAGPGENLGSPDFITISGPGGSAHVSLDPEQIPWNRRLWRTCVIQLVESRWTLDSGTWNDLIAWIDECRIDLEYIYGTETIGFDNFGVRYNICPRIDDPIVMHAPTAVVCDWFSLVDVAAIAFDPYDLNIYGTVRATAATGGGIYPVTGGFRGMLLHAYENPAGVVFDEAGHAYISEDYGGNVYRCDAGGSSSIWVSGFHTNDDDPYGMTFAPPGFNGPNVDEGDILVSDRGSGGPDQIWTFKTTAPEGERLLMPDPGEIDIFDLAAADSDTIYAADYLDPDNLYTLDTLGVLSPLPLSTPIPGLGSIVYDSLANILYAADIDNDAVYRIDPYTGTVDLFADGFADLYLCCLEFNAEIRRLWVADRGYGRVYAICLDYTTDAGDTGPAATGRLHPQVYPNPFNPAVRIRFTLPRSGRVSAEVFDAAGRRVRTLFDAHREAGIGEIVWDGRNDSGREAASGIYFVRISAGGLRETVKAVLLR